MKHVGETDRRSNRKRKISEALYIRTLKPTLSVKEKSIRPKLSF